MKHTIFSLILLFISTSIFAARKEILLNENWMFRFSHQVQFISEERVNLPHTWNSGDALSGKQDYYRGMGNYTKTLFVKPEWKGKRLFLSISFLFLHFLLPDPDSFIGSCRDKSKRE